MFFPFPINPLFPFPINQQLPSLINPLSPIPNNQFSPFPFSPINAANPNVTIRPEDVWKAMGENLSVIKHSMSNNGIEIDIPNVAPETKVSDLSVHQFVNLLAQVNKQLSASPEPAGAFIEQLQKLNAQKGVIDPSAFNDMVKQIHQSIRDQISELKSQVSPGSMKPSEEKK